jgi:hypothetical protein
VVVVVYILVVGGLVTLVWSLVVLARRIFGGITRTDSGPARPYGGLPDLDPVGELGQPSPDADISQTGSDSQGLYGA